MTNQARAVSVNAPDGEPSRRKHASRRVSGHRRKAKGSGADQFTIRLSAPAMSGRSASSRRRPLAWASVLTPEPGALAQPRVLPPLRVQVLSDPSQLVDDNVDRLGRVDLVRAGRARSRRAPRRSFRTRSSSSLRSDRGGRLPGAEEHDGIELPIEPALVRDGARDVESPLVVPRQDRRNPLFPPDVAVLALGPLAPTVSIRLDHIEAASREFRESRRLPCPRHSGDKNLVHRRDATESRVRLGGHSGKLGQASDLSPAAPTIEQ